MTHSTIHVKRAVLFVFVIEGTHVYARANAVRHDRVSIKAYYPRNTKRHCLYRTITLATLDQVTSSGMRSFLAMTAVLGDDGSPDLSFSIFDTSELNASKEPKPVSSALNSFCRSAWSK